MSRRRTALSAVLFLTFVSIVSFVQPDRARAQYVLATAGASGDQLLFFYDATAGHVPFLAVSYFGDAPVTVEVAWYSQDLNRRLATQYLPLVSGGHVILDPSQVQGVDGNAGLTVVTPVVSATDPRPVVPSQPDSLARSTSSGTLAGGFTLADTASKSAFGQNPFARVAVDSKGTPAAGGAIVDGSQVRYQNISPEIMVIPFYFNPSGTTPLTNRVLLGVFEDRYGGNGFGIGPLAKSFLVKFANAAGDTVAENSYQLNGVGFIDVATLAGTRLTSSGKVAFQTSPLPLNQNVLGLMSQSLGTFSVGQGLPGYRLDAGLGHRFSGNDDGTVLDRKTGLTWEVKSPPGTGDVHDSANRYSWSSSGQADGTVFTDFLRQLNGGPTGVGNCSSSDGITQTGGFAGHCDWRLPTIAELRTLVDFQPGCGSPPADPCIAPILGPTAALPYFTSTLVTSESLFVMAMRFVDMDTGNAGDLATVVITNLPGLPARAVRGAMKP